MSDLVVEVCTVDDVQVHPNGEFLELLIVKGWQVCEKKGAFSKGDKCVFFDPNTCIPLEKATELGVAAYLDSKNGRVKAIRLRGEPSMGLIVKPADPNWEVGKDVAEYYGATKYEPPVKGSGSPGIKGKTASIPAFVQEYTHVQNLRHNTDVFEAGENVVVTEKIHGTNCVVYAKKNEVKRKWWQLWKPKITSTVDLYARSHKLGRARPENNDFASSTYWLPFTHLGLKTFMEREVEVTNTVVGVACEIYGSTIQGGFSYDAKASELKFRIFDISHNGKYINFADFKNIVDAYNIPHAPILYTGPYSLEKIKELSSGPSTLIGQSPFREGVVVKPVVERTHPKLGRVILKYISDDYLIKRDKISDSVDI